MNLSELLSPERIFSVASGVAMLSWAALALSPWRARWSARVRWVAGRLVPLLLAVVYVLLFANTGMAGGGYDSLGAVQRLMAHPALLTAGWLHYLAFDLFVGTWIAERGGTLGMPHLLIVALLLATFMFGPAGLLAFAVTRLPWARRDTAAAPA